MSNKALLVITHGNFGIELVKSVEMIMGEQEDVNALGLNPGESVEDLRESADRIVEANKEAGKETIILVDILGGSPSNVALYLFKKHGIKLITGVNMYMLIEMFSQKDSVESADELCDIMIETATENIKKF
ncbi:PTS sugar transporter subunit IIA [Youngiibacter multivorans]|uniref:PTS system mannose-specific IIA component n=1 Tax=Youngiibacter multivorans TaxID=937251 RepID=A0ABS4FZV6_9CLOT|nr:PTS sugar transporter subunit IIA [Youngiibacter multivorans]MBP1917766.1 PTS system mannose-specific IIA component [Youngiibacter multivorans]